ncbi:MAG: ribosome small subunit-dependent GTPase A [Anaerolineales bacterium]|nr:ribosome small subunit-dependent GTPase A [Chloroflexota bacterium]MBL6979991.1 ribosome small subunit-dependent GTPase A [Anaerolineales bacterium]
MDDNKIQIENYSEDMQKHVRKQQLRNTRRKSGPKNKAKKPRQKEWIPDSWDDIDDLDYSVDERIMPRGEEERRREIERKALSGTSGGNSERAADPQGSEPASGSRPGIPGLVVGVSSGMCRVDIHNGAAPILCDIRGSLKSQETGFTNVVAAGDQVKINLNGEQRGVVEEVLPRRSILARPYRPDVGKISSKQQIVVANIDRVLIVASWREPNIWPALIDRYLIAVQRNQLEAVICVNKIDLVEDPAEFQATIKPYQDLGFRLILTSAETGAGIDELAVLLKSSTTVLAGLSGVGKSTLLTAIQPSLDLRVGKVTQRGTFTGQGRHTTTQSRLWNLENGGVVIDTPGIREFGLVGIKQAQLAEWYPEMVDHLGGCRYSDCSHSNEPGCAIKAAVANGAISELRYKNYTQIYDELCA